jgi:uncharacterized coiled-coil DUF342 family protein
MRKNIFLVIQEKPTDLGREQHSNGDGGSAATTRSKTATRAAASGTTVASTSTSHNVDPPKKDIGRDQNVRAGTDSNLITLLEFKKTLLEEQKKGEEQIQALNIKIDSTKQQIDDERIQLENLRVKLKHTNEQKDTELTRYTELKNTLMEARNQIKSADEKNGTKSALKSRSERRDMGRLARILEQIERDIQTKKLSKDEERRLVARSKEVATKLHALKTIYKKEDDYRNISSQYELLKARMNKIFDQKSEFGDKIGKLKGTLDTMLNLRESLYAERRALIHVVREAKAKLEMVDTQLNAIQFRKSRQQAAESRLRRSQQQRRPTGDHEERRESIQERAKRNKENQERWNTMKEAALKKMSTGEKLTFDEMKLIYGDGISAD